MATCFYSAGWYEVKTQDGGEAKIYLKANQAKALFQLMRLKILNLQSVMFLEDLHYKPSKYSIL